MNINLKQAPSNYLRQINFVIKTYESVGENLCHGFQKDVIQNAVGARLSINKWNNWKCNIDVVTNNIGTFLIVEDFGTTGLTGPNLSINVIEEMCDRDDVFPENYRLARISCRNVSDDIQTGPGLFGVGKTLYSAASSKEICTYYFDSIIDGGEYRANVNRKNKLRVEGALLDDEAKLFIKEKTGLDPISHQGTRFIIVDPKQEILDYFYSGQMYYDAQETWWRIVDYWDPDGGIFINGKRVTVPEQYKENNYLPNRSRFSEKQSIIFDGYSLKKIGFAICNKLDEKLSKFYFYRRGMKIGEIELRDIPKEIEGKYFGYIELQSDYEDLLAKIEDAAHFDVARGKKNYKEYSAMRDYVREWVNESLISWGYIKDNANDNSKFQNLAKKIQENVQELFKDQGFDELGKGDIKKSYISGFCDVKFPNPDEGRTVHDGDKIKFKFYIKNKTSFDKKYNVFIETKSFLKSSIIFTDKIVVKAENKFRSNEIVLDVNKDVLEKFESNSLILRVEPEKGRTNDPSKLVIYYEIATEKKPEFDFDLIMSNREMPRVNNKRVNFDECIKNIEYSISNNTNFPANIMLIVSTLTVDNGSELIEKCLKETYVIDSFSSIQSNPFDIIFAKDIYDNFLSSGKICIRARIIANEATGNYQKGERLRQYDYFVFFNKNEKSGIEDSFKIQIVENVDDKRCSWIEGRRGDRKIFINTGHPEFKLLSGEKDQNMYITRLMIKEFAYLYVIEGNLSKILPDDPNGENTDRNDFIRLLNQKIDELWWLQCQN